MSTALLLIDIQNDYFPGGSMEVEGSVAASLKARDLLVSCRAQGLPVIHIRHISTRPAATFFIPGTPGAEIHANVAPLPGEPVIVKHFPNSFRETDLLSLLRGTGIDRIVICGMMTHMCVDATVRAAFDLGFSCTVVHDACATRMLSFNGVEVPASHVHTAFLAAFAVVYGTVTGVEEVVRNL